MIKKILLNIIILFLLILAACGDDEQYEITIEKRKIYEDTGTLTYGIRVLNVKNIAKLYTEEELAKVEDLVLNHAEIMILDGIEKFVNAWTISLSNNNLKDIRGLSVLKNSKRLRQLYISNNQITSLEGIEELLLLKDLWANDNQIKEIKGLNNLKNLKYLMLKGNQIEKISGLNRLVNLDKLSLAENKIKVIEGLDNLYKLQAIELNVNQIEEINGLDDMEIPLCQDSCHIVLIFLERSVSLFWMRRSDNICATAKDSRFPL